MSHLAGTPRFAGATNTLKAIEQVAGAAPHTCPWRAYEDDTVRDVLDLYRMAQTDREGNYNLAAVRALNPPNHLWEGLQWYAHALTKCIEQRRADEEAARDRKRRLGIKG